MQTIKRSESDWLYVTADRRVYRAEPEKMMTMIRKRGNVVQLLTQRRLYVQMSRRERGEFSIAFFERVGRDCSLSLGAQASQLPPSSAGYLSDVGGWDDC